MGLQRFERRLERLFEGAFAKAFRSGLEPVELGRRLAREMDRARTVGTRSMIAPNQFTFALSPTDAERFGSFSEALAAELASAARDHAREEQYAFLGPVEVAFTTDRARSAGSFDLAARVVAAPGGGVFGALVLPNGHRVDLGATPVSLGRMDDCDIVLADPNVSRRHAEVRQVDDGFEVVDLDSLNGTRVNGRPVRQQRLSDGDELTIGATPLHFEMS